ncbi:MAG: hypothetical protein QNK37_21495 [Acidobacteriota bacterium]|nr:hypothetical protein [Acidobacteriota bacterium]
MCGYKLSKCTGIILILLALVAPIVLAQEPTKQQIQAEFDNGLTVKSLLAKYESLTVSMLKGHGFTAKELLTYRASIQDLLTNGFVLKDLKGLVSVDQLIEEGVSPKALVKAGFLMKDLRQAGADIEGVFEGLTINQLYQELEAQELENLKRLREAEAQVDEDMVKKGDENPSSTGDTVNTLKNFASLFLGQADLVTSDEERNGAVFELSATEHFKAEALIREPELFGSIRQAFTEDQMEQLETLKDSLDELDGDITLQFSWNITRGNLGRSLKVFLDDTLDEEDLKQHLSGEGENLTTYMSKLKKDLEKKGFSGEVFSKPIKDLQLEEEEKQEIFKTVNAAVGANMQLKAKYRKLLAVNGLKELTELASNQDQLYFSFFYNARDDLVGPDSFGLSFNFEWGFANLDSYLRQDKNFKNFYTDNEAKIKREWRLAFKGEWTRTEDYDFTLDNIMNANGDPVRLQEEAGNEWSLQAAAGFNLLSDKKPRGRLELSLTRDFKGDKDMKNNRFIAQLSYTRKVVKGVAVPVALVYADKPEFLDDLVDDKVSARIGIRFKAD